MKADFNWSDLAFASKKPLRALEATFIVAPRELSQSRLSQLVKQYLPLGNIVIGISVEPYVLGFEDQPQFRMLQLGDVQEIAGKIHASSSPNKLYTLACSQREQKYLFEKTGFKRAVMANGSWKYMFHTTETFYALVKAGVPYERVSPFANEQEARDFETSIAPKIAKLETPEKDGPFDERDMLAAADRASRASYDHSYQTGSALGKKQPDGSYELIATSFNRVVPFQTYAWHTGPSREANFSPPGDLNHYDAVHAEVELVIQMARRRQPLDGTTLFINLLPCPSCARMLSETDIAEIIYREDHSAGYAVQLLEKAGKTVRRVVPETSNKEG